MNNPIAGIKEAVGIAESGEGIGDRIDLRALLADSHVSEVLDELDRELIGLKPVKARVRDIAALLLVAQIGPSFSCTARETRAALDDTCARLTCAA